MPYTQTYFGQVNKNDGHRHLETSFFHGAEAYLGEIVNIVLMYIHGALIQKFANVLQ